MTPRTDPHLAELERQIAETREALGQTVEELAAKVDVPTRAKAKARDTADRLRARLPGGSAGASGGPAELSAGSGAHRAEIPAAPDTEAAPETEAAAAASPAASGTAAAEGSSSGSAAASAVSAVRSYGPAVAAATVSAAAAAALVWFRHSDRS